LFATGVKKTTIDEVIPHFHQRVKKGEVFFNPYYSEEKEGVRVTGNSLQYERISPISCSGVSRNYAVRNSSNDIEVHYGDAVGMTRATGWMPSTRDLINSSDVENLVIELSTRVRSDRGRSDSNLWETLAESDKVLGTLTGVFKNALGAFQRKNLKGFTKEATSGYLGWRYGIKPLISDVDAVTKGLAKKVGRMRKTTRSANTMNSYEHRIVTKAYGDLTVRCHEQSFDEVNVRCMSLDEYVATTLNNIGLSSKGLITLPWELVSYSFVADWFANIGDYLGAITPAFGWTQLGSCVSIRRERRLEVTNADVIPASGIRIVTPCSGGYTLRRSTRQRYTGLPQPQILVRSDFRFQNLTRCVDAFSLLAQRVINKG
jgi:hypothetical protein